MPPLPVLSGAEARQAFEQLGWKLVRQKGSHMIMVRPGSMASLSIPNHKELRTGTLRGLIRAAGVSVDDFVATLNR